MPSLSRGWETNTPIPVTSKPVTPPAPRRYPLRKCIHTNRYGFATQSLANSLYQERYANHIASFTSDATLTQEKTKLLPLCQLFHGEDVISRLLPRGDGKNRPANECIEGTSTIFPIRKSHIPKGYRATYVNHVCDIRPNKAEKNRVRITAGGDQLDFPDDPTYPVVAMIDSKIHINSTIFDAKRRGARYMSLDIKSFYLGTPLEYYQYLCILASMTPQEIFDEYPELVIEEDGYVYFEIRKGIYGLKEAGIIAFQQLVKNLDQHGYEPMPFTPGLWRHRSRPTAFTLCVDDFGVKFFSKADAQHLISSVEKRYQCTVDWSVRIGQVPFIVVST
jgi:hypothetical protein